MTTTSIKAGNGYLQLSDDVLAVITAANFTSAEYKCLLVALKDSWGWQKDTFTAGFSKFAARTNLSRRAVSDAVQLLKTKNILTVKVAGSCNHKETEYLVNTITEWCTSVTIRTSEVKRTRTSEVKRTSTSEVNRTSTERNSRVLINKINNKEYTDIDIDKEDIFLKRTGHTYENAIRMMQSNSGNEDTVMQRNIKNWLYVMKELKIPIPEGVNNGSNGASSEGIGIEDTTGPARSALPFMQK